MARQSHGPEDARVFVAQRQQAVCRRPLQNAAEQHADDAALDNEGSEGYSTEAVLEDDDDEAFRDGRTTEANHTTTH